MLRTLSNRLTGLVGTDMERYSIRTWAKNYIQYYRKHLGEYVTKTSISNFDYKDNKVILNIKSYDNPYQLVMQFFENSTFRVQIFNNNPNEKSYNLDDLLGNIKLQPLKLEASNIIDEGNRLIITINDIVVIVSIKSTLVITYQHNKKTICDILPFILQPSFSPTAVVRYYQSSHLSGLCCHADSLLLKDTLQDKPYQFYNNDKFLWPVKSKGAIYGGSPLLFNFGKYGQSTLFWRNVSETYVDISTQPNYRQVLFLSETNDLDIYMMFNVEKPVRSLYSNLQKILGQAFLPPYWSLGYQHSRFSFMGTEDLMGVERGFDQHHIPVDAFYLDLHHIGEEMRFFTWSEKLFPDPGSLLEHLHENHRWLLTIQDPHFRDEIGYHIHDAFVPKDLVVMKGGVNYKGKGWPGASYYIDFIDEDARAVWAEQYDLKNYKNSQYISAWNDLNEPTVFGNKPDNDTMPKDCTHKLKLADGEKITLLHKQVKQSYGLLQAKATFEGLKARDNNERRNIVLTRSFFTGVQQYAMVWTADTESSYKYLAISTPMFLGYAMSGMSQTGGDIPGFLAEPTDDLCQRWYQLGMFQPFFRSHSDIGTPRREPWLFCAKTFENIKKCVQWRYELLPYWYTQFHDNHTTGMPVLRPLWMNFPNLEQIYTEEQTHFVGDSLIVVPVISSNQQWFDVSFLNGIETPVYDYWTNQYVKTEKLRTQKILPDRVAVFALGGTIIPCYYIPKSDFKNSYDLQYNNSLHIKIYLDSENHAIGKLFVDDGITYKFQEVQISFQTTIKGFFLLLQLECKETKLTIKRVEGEVTIPMSESPIYNKFITKVTLCRPNQEPLVFEDLHISILEQDQTISLEQDIKQDIQQEPQQ